MIYRSCILVNTKTPLRCRYVYIYFKEAKMEMKLKSILREKSVVKVAHALTELGFSVTPLHGKIPYQPEWQKKGVLSEAELDELTEDHNIGIVCGFNNLFILDLDEIEICQLFVDKFPSLAKTLTVKTRRGKHHYYQADHLPQSGKVMGVTVNGMLCNIELLCEGFQAVLPPSIHPETGQPYKVDNHDEILWLTQEEVDCIVEWFNGWKAVKREQEANVDKVTPIKSNANVPKFVNDIITGLTETSSGRNNALNEASFSIGQFVAAGIIDIEVARTMLFEAATKNGYVEKDGEKQTWATINSGLTAGIKQPRFIKPLEFDEQGSLLGVSEFAAAERLIEMFGNKLLYVHQFKKWYIWNGIKWELDEVKQVYQFAKEVARSYHVDAQQTKSDKQHNAVIGHIRNCLRGTTIKAILELATSEGGVSINPDELDNNPSLLAAKNGVIDLNEGEIIPPNQDQYITQQTNVPFDANAGCPVWLQFLDDIMAGDKELIAFLQRAVGYTLTGSTKEQVFFIMYGTGKNGKSTFIDVLSKLLGSMAHKATFGTFASGEIRGFQATPDLANFYGKRLVYASEGERSTKLSESLIKDITGGERIKARRLYENEFTFYPTFKIWLSSNHKPNIVGTDLGIWRRVVFIPFNVTIHDDKVDRSLAEKLESELQGILAWAVKGSVEWYQNGLQPAQAVQEATNQYQNEQNSLTQFIDMMCENNSSHKMVVKVFKDNYAEFCNQMGTPSLPDRAITDELRKLGYKIERGTGNKIYVKGVSLKEGNI